MARRDRLAAAVCALGVGTAILLIGGATRGSQALVALVAVGAVGVAFTSRRAFERWPPLLVLLFATAGWTLLQWIPLPGGVSDALSPTLASLRTEGSTLAGVAPWTSLSMDPPATLRALTFLLTLSGLAYLALRLAVSERGRYVLTACVAAGAALAAIVTGFHELFGVTSLYGVYEPRHGAPLLMAPLLNPNHMGGLMAVGVVTCVGLVVYPKQTSLRRAGWVVLGLVCVAATLATRSRGAILGLASGVVVAALMLVVQRIQAIGQRSRRRREKFFATTVPIGVMIACGLTVAVYLGAGTVMQQLENTSLQEVHAPTSKFAAWRSTFVLVEEAPLVGVGRGAFESTFTRVHPASALTTFSNPENEGLQALVEWGVGPTLVFVVLAGWMFLIALRRWNDGPLAAGALGAIVVVLFQSNFDFGMELLGLAVPIVILIATLTYVPLAEFGPRRAKRIAGARVLHGLAILAGGILLLTSATRLVDEDHDDLALAPDRATIDAAIARHPLDYVGYGVLAEQLVKAKDPGAVPMLNHALRLHPTHPSLHLLAARLLVRSGRLGQAESEYTTAIRFNSNPRRAISEVARVLGKEGAARAIPVDQAIDATIRTLDSLGRSDVAVLWLDRVLTYSDQLPAAEALYSLAMRDKNYPAAERATRRRCEMFPSTRCKVELANLLALEGKPREVVALLDDVGQWIGRQDDKLAAWLLLCDAEIALEDFEKARECLRHLDVSGLIAPGDTTIQRRRDALPARAVPGMPVKPTGG